MAYGQTELEGVLHKFVELARERVRVSQVILYGSHAHGKAHELSDINLVVISPDFGQHKLKEMRMLSEIALDCSDDIEALPYGDLDFIGRVPGSFLDEVIKTGKVIYSK